ncbi:phosphoglycerate mutase (2,3-diphosphoglycerate-independent) [Helicobacter enhydrae]|uniref:2,3-bisphosphoglycerate-independent phosphoglycerate mutase n=1 Tax=Helicobacter enhydrae TaxID=222136 RepID=A0A1B1U536_9HELI|nr:2,3-bisphosphoglycerate-independent phosphoglycerate mutase [Helicobacter enhydrae]ANV97868.1 phosphoglycerate mutase (2,3-diphosphoglycerate-independent) [Helicobacter enhydrae]
MQKVILVITDGIGHSTQDKYNAFKSAATPAYDWLFANAPHSLIRTYGESIGLPNNQMGNSEVGHMTLGSGQVILQDLLKINQAIHSKTLFANEHFQTLKTRENIHLVGLVSDGGVHSDIAHLVGILKELKQSDNRVWIHIIADGRDVAPQSLQTFLDTLQPHLSANIQIATLSGRYYAMDRDRRWERIQSAYDCIISANPKTTQTPSQYLAQSYQDNISDEFIIPTAFGSFDGVENGDAFLFFNFRSDRMRELTFAIGSKDFNHFQRPPLKDLFLLCMTPYDENFPLPTLINKENLTHTLASIISQAQLTQAHIAETEKYAHVTFFFNGGREKVFDGESRFLIPSPKVATYDLKPEMSAEEVGEQTLKCMQDGFDFIVVNFANGDMVGHTGVFEAGIKAVEAVDTELLKILQACQQHHYALILTSDHGNCEEMRDQDGNILTNHTIGDVWCFALCDQIQSLDNGTLANIAPTILKIMGLPIPTQMQKPLF